MEAKLTDIGDGDRNGPESAIAELLEEALEARDIVDSARAVLHDHLQEHLATASLADAQQIAPTDPLH